MSWTLFDKNGEITKITSTTKEMQDHIALNYSMEEASYLELEDGESGIIYDGDMIFDMKEREGL